jgi:E3 ubiquitin-protein ligase RNF13
MYVYIYIHTTDNSVRTTTHDLQQKMIVVLVLIHICIVGRVFRRGFSNGTMVERGWIGSTSMSRDDLDKLPCYDYIAKEERCSPVDCSVCLENFKMGD